MLKPKSHFYFIHVIVFVIFVACLLMNGPMRGGLPLDNELPERIQFILENTALWQLSWCIWMLAALGLYSFCTLFAMKIEKGLYRTLGLSFVAMGIVPDTMAEVIYAFVIPKSAMAGASMALLGVLETSAMHLTGFLGNGLYNLGALVLTLGAWRQSILSLPMFTFGLLAWLLGLALSASIALGSTKGAEIFTALSMVTSTLWMLAFAYIGTRGD